MKKSWVSGFPRKYIKWSALVCGTKRAYIDQQTFLWPTRSSQVSPAQTSRPPHPASCVATLAPPGALHQNDDGNPILPTSGTEARFYKLRDLCQYFTRIADGYPELDATLFVWNMYFVRERDLALNFINLRGNVNRAAAHLLIVVEFPNKFLSKYFC